MEEEEHTRGVQAKKMSKRRATGSRSAANETEIEEHRAKRMRHQKRLELDDRISELKKALITASAKGDAESVANLTVFLADAESDKTGERLEMAKLEGDRQEIVRTRKAHTVAQKAHVSAQRQAELTRRFEKKRKERAEAMTTMQNMALREVVRSGAEESWLRLNRELEEWDEQKELKEIANEIPDPPTSKSTYPRFTIY